jgi:hypothetical protein
MCRLGGSLSAAVKPKAEEDFRTPAMLVIYTVRKQCHNKSCMFFQGLYTDMRIPGRWRKWRLCCSHTCRVFLTNCRKPNSKAWGVLQWRSECMKFRENWMGPSRPMAWSVLQWRIDCMKFRENWMGPSRRMAWGVLQWRIDCMKFYENWMGPSRPMAWGVLQWRTVLGHFVQIGQRVRVFEWGGVCEVGAAWSLRRPIFFSFLRRKVA